MDYGNLLSRAFNISWKHKILWVLGFFAASAGAFGGIQNQLSEKTEHWFGKINPDLSDAVVEWFEFNPEVSIALVLMVIGIALLLALVFFVMSLICIAGLIDGVVRIEGNRGYTLKGLFKSGASYFWRFLGLFFIFLAIAITTVMLLVAPFILAIVAVGGIAAILLIFIIPIGIVAVFFFGNIYSLTQREIVVNQTPIFGAIGEGYKLLIRHLGPNIVIFIINTFLWIAIVIAGLLLVAIFIAPILILAALSKSILILALVIGIPLFIALSVVLEGFLGTFFNSLMTLFYLELRKLTPLEAPAASQADMAAGPS
jgi:hypothetical protein